MLKKENRLKSKSAFSATYHNNISLSTDSLVLYLGKIKNDKNCPTRVGFVVSKKVHKRAVKRNRIKRILRENIRLFFKDNSFSFLNNYQSLIFIAKQGLLDKNYTDIEKNILTIINKLAIKNL